MTETFDSDWRLRYAAFARLRELREQKNGVDLVTRAELNLGFKFEGEQISLADRWSGIWKPRQLGRDGAALSILTAAPRPGRPAPYDDDLDESKGYFVYKYEGDNPDLSENRAVRRARELGRPLVYFVGIRPGVFQALYPAYITDDSPADLSFRVEVDTDVVAKNPMLADVLVRAPDREYATRAVKVRLHQRRFRELVMGAYRSRCTICRLRHEDLLDAAHILEDRHERGLPEVPNGLALCKIHHSAYDLDILGIDQDYYVHVSEEVLAKRDGPMLQHGLKEMQDVELVVPGSAQLQPNREFLAERFKRFRAA
jgi:putative restriction endonuclease